MKAASDVLTVAYGAGKLCASSIGSALCFHGLAVFLTHPNELQAGTDSYSASASLPPAALKFFWVEMIS